MQYVDSAFLEQRIRDESKAFEIYSSKADEQALDSELIRIELTVILDRFIDLGARTAVLTRRLALAEELKKASQQNYRQARKHRRRLQRLMSQYDALTEG